MTYTWLSVIELNNPQILSSSDEFNWNDTNSLNILYHYCIQPNHIDHQLKTNVIMKGSKIQPNGQYDIAVYKWPCHDGSWPFITHYDHKQCEMANQLTSI